MTPNEIKQAINRYNAVLSAWEEWADVRVQTQETIKAAKQRVSARRAAFEEIVTRGRVAGSDDEAVSKCLAIESAWQDYQESIERHIEIRKHCKAELDIAEQRMHAAVEESRQLDLFE